MDNVNHPAHYTQYPVEVIEVTSQLGFVLGNAVKYLARAEYKGNASEDYAKALWYIDYLRRNPFLSCRVNKVVRRKAMMFENPIIDDLLTAFSAGKLSLEHRCAALDRACSAIKRKL